MTDLISAATFRRLTGDTTTSDDDIDTALDEALSLVEEELNGRPLENIERTESLVVKNGVVYPRATPITYADDYVIRDAAVEVPDPTLEWGMPQTFELTYQGGFTEATLPVTLRNAIVEVAKDQLRAGSSTASSFPVGATQVKHGDSSITFAEPVGSFGLSGVRADVAKSIRRYRKARL